MEKDEKLTTNDLQTILKEHLEEDDDLDDARSLSEDSESNSNQNSSKLGSDYIDLSYSGDALDENELSKLQLQCHPKVIAVLGDTGSGKSTLIQSIYEAFQRGLFNGKSFHGSKTLLGFDKRSHFARLSSNSSIPSTPRTGIGDGVKYYHVSIYYDKKLKHIVISDRAGEYFNQCFDEPSLVKNFQEMYIADEIIILLDGEKIITPHYRSLTLSNLRKYLRIINDIISKDTPNIHINLCISKYDLIDKYDKKNTLMESIEDFFSSSQNECRKNGITINMHRIAARSIGHEYNLAYGIDGMFENWCSSPYRSNNIFFEDSPVIFSDRQIDLFK